MEQDRTPDETSCAPAPVPDVTSEHAAPAVDAQESAIPAEELTRMTDDMIAAIKTVYDPEIPVNIYDLGLIYTIDIDDENAVKVAMSLTAPGCPVAGEMPGWIAEAIEPLPGVKTVDVELVWEPPWGMDMMSDEARLELGFM